MQLSVRAILGYAFMALAWGLAAAAFVLYQVQAEEALSQMGQMGRTVELSSRIRHQIHIYNACRWTVLGVGLTALLLFPFAVYTARYSCKRIFFANWGRGERDGLKKKSQAVRAALIGVCVLLFIAAGAAVASISSNLKAQDTLEASRASMQSGEMLLTDASSTLTSLKGGNSTSTGLAGLIQSVTSLASRNNQNSQNGTSSPPPASGLAGLFGSLASLGGSSDSASAPTAPSSGGGGILNTILNLFSQSSTTGGTSTLYDLLTKDNLQELAPILKQMTVGTLLDAIDASPSGLLQLLSALNKLISSGSSGNTCASGCLQTQDACICTFNQIESLSGMFAPTAHDLDRALIGSCLLVLGFALLFTIAAHEAAVYGFQEGLVYSDRFDRQLAVKNAMQSRRNLNITAYTPQQPPQQPGKIRDKVTTEEKVEAGTAGSAV